ncbi:MAG: hypothetical protein JXQ75_15265 [Phycisphaerae bacterium]|nr:hypothetical protein [Phycisphaerae bacterium]
MPLQHIHEFFATRRLPANATVDLAYCARSDRSIQTLQGGNKRFAIRDPNVSESDLKDTYLITLHFDHVMFRLGWTPVTGIRAQPVPKETVHRLFPPPGQDILVQATKGKVFLDHVQFHFLATIFSEDGLFDRGTRDSS